MVIIELEMVHDCKACTSISPNACLFGIRSNVET